MKGASRCINDVIRRISPTLKMSDMSREESYDLLKWARCRQTLYSLLNLEHWSSTSHRGRPTSSSPRQRRGANKLALRKRWPDDECPMPGV
ncbi:hypothetical protein KQX54_010821 [Cotesia glomerata]|uniref:Uncharacterized protein n=1 Tax=Cotesia glomerata TaxID=32391 RepID=A0AAV7J977_COTGL|nr:hypothetical protein KQX54_010821 [Cotesia glomerata]